MKVSRGIETVVKEGIEEMVFDRYRYRWGVEEQSIRCKNRSSINPLAFEKLSRRRELSRSIHHVLRNYQDCNMKKLKKLDRQQGIEEVLGQLLKTVFRDEKKHRHECNPTCNSTNDPINILSFQNHLLIKILSI